MAEEKNNAQAPETKVEIIGVNFREAGKIYYFAPIKYKLEVNDYVIVETTRGVEIGRVKIANMTISSKEITSPLKSILRPASKDDIAQHIKNKESEIEAAIICKRKIAHHKLEMSLVAAEYTFDRTKLTFYFTCESRVDFRELVKDLASTFHTRIELRQIGIRDETKMMGGLGVCGRKYCCAGFLTDFVQVSIKMAKEQNFSLNSSKASGMCGRLMCCLRYEHDTYDEAIKKLPEQGSLVQTPDGNGIVTEIKPLSEEIRVKLNDNDKDQPKLYKFSAIKVLRSKTSKDTSADSNEG